MTRHAYDFYPTPQHCVHSILDALPISPRAGDWLEPCAGGGAIIKAVRSWVDEKLPPQEAVSFNHIFHTWTAIEIRREAAPELMNMGLRSLAIGDFLKTDLGCQRFNICLTNPPYDLALPFIEKSMRHCLTTVMMLRLDFLGSEERAEFHRKNPADIYVLPNRASCDGSGNTGQYNYAWFVWGQLAEGGRWKVLPSVHKDIRKLDKNPYLDRPAVKQLPLFGDHNANS